MVPAKNIKVTTYTAVSPTFERWNTINLAFGGTWIFQYNLKCLLAP